MAALPQKELTLDYPFDHDGQSYTTLTVRMPTVGDQLDVMTDGVPANRAEVSLLAHLCAMPVEAMRHVATPDYTRLQAALMGFLQAAERKA